MNGETTLAGLGDMLTELVMLSRTVHIAYVGTAVSSDSLNVSSPSMSLSLDIVSVAVAV